MKIALLIMLGLLLGLLAGAAVGIGVGVAWIGLFKSSSFEGYSSMLVFFTFMPIGAILGAAFGAILFGVMASRAVERAIEPLKAQDRDGIPQRPRERVP